MKVVEHEPHCWFLLEHEGEFYLDANCNHSFVGYSLMIQLNANEVTEYQNRGPSFLSEIAREIQESAPILEASASAYKGRDVSKLHATKVIAAVREWKAKGDAS